MFLKFKNNQKGMAVIITVMFIAFMITIVTALTSIVLPRVAITGQIKKSVTALFAADSAVEWCLYYPKSPGLAQPAMQNGATVAINPAPSAPYQCSLPGAPPFKTTGTYQGVTRSIDIRGF